MVPVITKIEFTVEGEPKSQPRPLPVHTGGGRFRMVSTKSSKGDWGAEEYREAIRVTAKRMMIGNDFRTLIGPLKITIELIWSRVGRLKSVDGASRVWKDCGEDWDNVGKAICDAMNKVVYDDDSQIAVAIVKKFYGRVGEVSHTRITVESLCP